MPNTAEIKLLLADVCLRLGEPRDALAALQGVPHEPGQAGEILLLSAEAQALIGNFAAADTDLSAALKRDPGNPGYLVAYAWLQQSERRYEDALTTLSKVPGPDIGLPAIIYRSALSYFFLNEKEEAARHCEQAIRIAPKYAQAYVLLGLTRLDEKNFPGSEDALRRAIKLKPDVPSFHMILGIALYKDGKLEESQRELDRALALDPQLSPAYFYRARLSARKADRKKAIADLEVAVALQPHYREAYSELARLYSAEGQMDKATAAAAKEKSEQESERDEFTRMLLGVADAQVQ